MGFFTAIIEFFARFFLSIVFIINGLFKSTYYEETIEYMLSYDIPSFLAIPTIIFEIIFPLFTILGYKTRFSAFALFLFLYNYSSYFSLRFFRSSSNNFFFKKFCNCRGFFNSYNKWTWTIKFRQKI